METIQSYSDAIGHAYYRDLAIVIFQIAVLLEDVISTKSDGSRYFTIEAADLMIWPNQSVVYHEGTKEILWSRQGHVRQSSRV